MICILLVAGHAEKLMTEIETSSKHQHLRGVPKALLPGRDGKKILDYWWDRISWQQLMNPVYLVTNADKFKHFERWASASDFPIENVINDGTTTLQNRLGSLTDLDLALRMKKIVDSEILVIAGDMVYQGHHFNLSQVIKYFKSKKDGNVVVYYEMEDTENAEARGIIEICPHNSVVLRFLEKPPQSMTSSRNASVVFYGFRRETLPLITQYLEENKPRIDRSCGQFIEWLINVKNVKFYGMKLLSGFHMIGQEVGVKDYDHWLSYVDLEHETYCEKPISLRTYARVGLMGNPSDGFYGKTISLSIANFWATVVITASKKLKLIPHPLNDPTEFGSLADLHGTTKKDGYLGGLRLLQAGCKIFFEYCCKNGISLSQQNFTLKYDTNIPRQVGLAGSSAIVTGTLRCLMKFYHVRSRDIPKEILPQLILDAEKEELCINAGLQDRVVQVYGGLVYMDFSRNHIESLGHGKYTKMAARNLPHLWLAYIADPSDSGTIHSDINLRYQNGDPEVIEGMEDFARYTVDAKLAIENKDWQYLGDLMNQNFDLRLKLYGEEALGVKNMRLIRIGREHGAFVKFPGSGGAVVGMTENAAKLEILRRAYQEEGFVFVDIIPMF